MMRQQYHRYPHCHAYLSASFCFAATAILLLAGRPPCSGFVPLASRHPVSSLTRTEIHLREGVHKEQIHHPQQRTFPSTTSSYMSSDPENNDKDNNHDDKEENSSQFFLDRFIDPVIGDPGLPLGDAATSQIVGPSLQVFWLSFTHAPLPSWLHPLFDNYLWQMKGSLVAPTLIHGAGLACCWGAGALAAEAFAEDAYNLRVSSYATIITKIVKAGSFAVGLLILATQADLLFEYGRWIQPGESTESDARILTALVEVFNDVLFEAIAITSWRLYRAWGSTQVNE